MDEASVQELEELAGRFRAGEAEIAVRFFAQTRGLGEHRDWLRFQIAREARNLEEIANHERCAWVERLEESVSREDFVHLLTEDYQEIRHYAMLAYIYEGLTGESVHWRHLRDEAKKAPWYEPSRREHARWAEYRERGAKLELAAALFTRGGGGALFFGFVALRGGDYERLLAQASKIILKDELEHGASEGRDELFKWIGNAKDMAVAKNIIVEMSRIRLEMRSLQFANVLPEVRLEEICAGEIEALTTEKMLRACADAPRDWFEEYHRTSRPFSTRSIAD